MLKAEAVLWRIAEGPSFVCEHRVGGSVRSTRAIAYTMVRPIPRRVVSEEGHDLWRLYVAGGHCVYILDVLGHPVRELVPWMATVSWYMADLDRPQARGSPGCMRREAGGWVRLMAVGK